MSSSTSSSTSFGAKRSKAKGPNRSQIIKLAKFAGLALVLLFASTKFYCSYFAPGSATGAGLRKVEYEVRRGIGSYTVAKELHELGLINKASYFRLYLRVTGKSNKIKAGIYELNDGMSTEKIADVLTEGKVRMFSITIPEGYNNKQIADVLVKKKMVKDREAFLRLTRSKAVLRKYEIRAKSTEGYLFPDTYSVPKGYTAPRFQDLMLRRFFKQLKKVGVPESMTRKELQRRVILASIVEREAVRSKERPMMAQVFLNRLDKDMKLESCATIQYLLKKPRARLYNRDLEIPSPYNTYMNKGLPPGPISNPGLAAIKASFKPKAGPYLFFVLKPDGSHYFSKTYGEHLAAKKRYLGR